MTPRENRGTYPEPLVEAVQVAGDLTPDEARSWLTGNPIMRDELRRRRLLRAAARRLREEME